MLNSKVLQHIRSNKKDGEITLKGSVIYRDGKVFLKIKEMENFSSISNKNPDSKSLPQQGEDYEIFLREEKLTEIPIDAAARVDQKSDNKTE